MTFNKISSSCDCLNSASENISNFFVRKVRKNKPLRENDFRNSIERNKSPENQDDCSEVCGFNSVSIDILTEQSDKELLERYCKCP